MEEAFTNIGEVIVDTHCKMLVLGFRDSRESDIFDESFYKNIDEFKDALSKDSKLGGGELEETTEEEPTKDKIYTKFRDSPESKGVIH